ncbi:MAG: YHS domain-containing (seleno)protein [Sedimenticola sp.]
MMIKRLLLTAVTLMLMANSALAAKSEIYTPFLGQALSGYDPVAYFTQGRPVKGSSKHTLEYKGETWRFSSEENRLAFERMPEKYAPRYGGYCAYAVASGYTASADPEAWSIVEGKLYLNYSKSVRDTWSRDIPGNIARADANWPKVLDN